jgi:NADH-quinone oxidoreductase subunit M
MLVLYRRVVFGPQDNPDAAMMPDLNRREYLILAPLAALVIILGVFPGTVMKNIEPSVLKVISQYQNGLEAASAGNAAATPAATQEQVQ